jgi:uridine phosphorylase
MVFPKYKNKHLEEALFSARDYSNYKKMRKDITPKKMIICYQKSIEVYFKKKFKGKFEKIKINNSLDYYKTKDIGFIKMKGVGSPNAATIMEELIALGVKEFINLGTAGGLYSEGVFLCSKAVRDEGTSHHYIKDGIYIEPDKKLTDRLGNSLEKFEINYQRGITWTIDAPYRETKKEIEYYKKLGVRTVEMEASALFAVAKVRKVKIASIFAVSDVLGKKWDPKFHEIDLKKTLNKLVDASIDCFNEED